MEHDWPEEDSTLYIDYTSPVSDEEESYISLGSIVVDTTSATASTTAGIKMRDLQTLIDDFSLLLNQAAITKSGNPTRLSTARDKGFAAEEFFKLTTKINALAEGVFSFRVGVYSGGSLPDGSILAANDPRVDLSIWTRRRICSKPELTLEVQSKIHNAGREKAYLKDKATPRYQDVTLIGAEGQNILPDKFSFEVGGKTITNDSITPEKASLYSEARKAQLSPEYEHPEEKRNQLNRNNLKDAIKAGAISGALASAIEEVYYTLKNRTDSEEDFVDAIKRILCGTIEGGIEGGIRSGAIMGSVQIIGKTLGKEIDMNGPSAIPVMAITNLAIDIAKDLYSCFISGTLSTDELLNRTIDKSFSSFSSFGGSWAIGKIGSQVAVHLGAVEAVKEAAATGAAIGSWFGPIGTIVGTIVGGLIINTASNLIINTAASDAQQRVIECIEKINDQIETEGCERHYIFVEALSDLSTVRLSFKGLLPCYNLISDLKEYSLRKKKLAQIREQLEKQSDIVDNEKQNAFKVIEKRELELLREKRVEFEQRRADLQGVLRESVKTYVSNSYYEYMSLYDVMSSNTCELERNLRDSIVSHNTVLDNLRNRVQFNEELNALLDDMMKDKKDHWLLEPIVKQLRYIMDRDEMIIGKQYISFEEALALVREVS